MRCLHFGSSETATTIKVEPMAVRVVPRSFMFNQMHKLNREVQPHLQPAHPRSAALTTGARLNSNGGRSVNEST